MSRRDAIRMTPEELAEFLDEQRTLTCATIGRDGWPHLMPLWYVVKKSHPPELWSWTYAKSQKVRNLERDPRCTLQIEAGESYGELRGVMIRAECELVRDVEDVAGIGAELTERYGGVGLTEELRETMRRQAVKRIGMHFVGHSTVTWDHRKLGGTY